MKDFDIYFLVTGLLLLSGFVSSSGLNFLTNLLNQSEYAVYGVLVCAMAIALIMFKLRQNKSSNNY
jgi:hypothetical protein